MAIIIVGLICAVGGVVFAVLFARKNKNTVAKVNAVVDAAAKK